MPFYTGAYVVKEKLYDVLLLIIGLHSEKGQWKSQGRVVVSYLSFNCLAPDDIRYNVFGT